MNINKKILSSPWFRYSIILLTGLFLGWLFFKDSKVAHEGHEHASGENTQNTIWTCSMHPQIRQGEPGQCPICGMDLIPASTGGGGTTDMSSFEMSPEAAALANVSVSKVETGKVQKELSLTGKIKVDEQRIATIASNFPGRIDQLYISFTGQEIKKGQKLATLYSPELITAQKELLEAARTKVANPTLYDAAREKLRSLKINEKQIASIENSGSVQTQFDIYSDRSGVVAERLVSVGDYVGRGSAMFDVVDLSRLWVMLDAFESDLPWIKIGDEIQFTVAAAPGKTFFAKVIYIDPVINPATRAASVRAETKNPGQTLKPEMFVNASISSSLDANDESLVIPKTAALWTGKRSVVYVKKPGTTNPTFEMREVTLGPGMGEMYVVKEGLAVGEEIVTNGVFSVDAAAQLQGKISMMNPEGGKLSTGHDHGQMEMDRETPEPKAAAEEVTGRFKERLANIFDEYYDLKNALVASDADESTNAAASFGKALDQVDMKQVKGEAHNLWMQKLEQLKTAAESIASTKDLEKQRASFSTLSDALHDAAQQFDLKGLDANYQYCPMALNDKGAYWMSKTEEINNPYFGESMLRCGETKERMN